MNEEDNKTLKYFKKVYDELMQDEKYQKYASLMDFYHKKIKQLQQENKELKKLNKIIYIDKSKAILDEFEKWLVENYFLNIPEVSVNSPIKKVYDKLQELKEGK